MIKVLGHRGCAGLEPENTIRAFKRALDLGVDLIEFDVRMTKDKKLVVIHDEKLDRTTNGKGFVRDFAFEEIKKLDAGKGEKIPSFEETLNLLKSEKPIIVIEIKEPQITEKILKIIKKENLENKVLIVSFWHNILNKIKEIEPEIKTGAILAGRPMNLVSTAKAAKSKLLCLRHEFIDEELVKNCHRKGIEINAWTVNELKDIERMIKLGIDIISSDYPNRVLAKLKAEK
ncbi:MAG: glycerophosphodiester phosphodiesterase family protein [Patescibacteria group bacterium]|nr:glycerophosphodiester phosphodiesterase family protein [Patescibacteria group bacterium]